MEALKETIQLAVDTSGIKAGSLSSLLAELKAMDGVVSGLYAKLGKGPTLNPQWVQNANLIRDTLEKSFKTKGPYAATDVFKTLGLDDNSVNQALARLDRIKSKLGGFQSKGATFSSIDSAVRGVAQVFKEERAAFEKMFAATQTNLGRAFAGGGVGAAVKGNDIGVKVDGQIALLIPGTQIQASVEGPITLKVSGNQFSQEADDRRQSEGTERGRNAATGQFTEGGGGGRKRRKRGGAQGLDIGGTADELGRVRTVTPEAATEAITRLGHDGEVITQIHDSIEGVIKTITKSTTGSTPMQQWRVAKRQMDAQYRQAVAGIAPGDLGHGLAVAQGNYASGLESLIAKNDTGGYTNSILSKMPAAQAKLVADSIAAAAATMRGQAAATRGGADAAALEELNAARTRNFAGYINTVFGKPNRGAWRGTARSSAEVFERLYGGNPPPPFDPTFARDEFSRPSMLPTRYQGYRRQRGGGPTIDAQWSEDDSIVDAEGKRIPRRPSRLSKAFTDGFSPEGLATHVVKVAGWAAAVTVLEKGLQLVEHTMARVTEVGSETAHLSVVYRGVGGSAKDLADDVMRLAAANGRSTDEAMESAQEWARLGLTRVQINEAVRVSLEAANAAQVPVAEATKQMSALMHVYGMNVGQLDNALGVLVNTSQKFNVTMEDLFGGLDRSASAAKIAGVSFAELQGLIGGTVGGTGQTGITIGNTLKNLFTQFTRPEIQGYLQSQGISTTRDGQFAGASEVMRQMFIRYQTMDATQRRNLGTVVAGRLQTARFAGLMNEYPESQKLAIDGELRENAASSTNTRIVSTIAAQAAGLGAEFDRGVTNGGLADSVQGVLRFSKNILHLLNGNAAAAGNGQKNPADMTDAELAAAAGAGQGGASFRHPYDQTDPGVYDELARRNVSRSRAGGQGFFGGFMGQRGTPGGVGLLQYFNAYQEYGQRQLAPMEQFSQQFGQRGGQVEAYGLMQRLFQTTSSLNGVNSEGANQARGIANGYLNDLGLPAGASYGQGAAAAAQKQQDMITGQLEMLAERKSEIDQMHASGSMKDDVYDKELDNLKKLTDESQHAADEEVDAITEQVNRRQEYVNLLKEQAGVMEMIGRLSSQVQTGTLGGQSDQELNAVKANLDALQAQKAALEGGGSSVPVANLKAYQEIVAQISEQQARQSMLESPRYQAAVTAYDNRSIAIKRADAESQSYAVGYTEAEKLLRQQSALQHQLDNTPGGGKVAGPATDNDIVRAQELSVDLAHTHEQIQMRIVELKAQEKQLIIDSNREFQKGMLLAGPGELLKRLYVQGRSSQPGFNTGSFMAMDPEARRMYYDLRGGEAGAKNREEQGLLAGMGLSVSGQQAQAARDRAATQQWGKALPNPVKGLPGVALPKEDPLVTQANKSSAALATFAAKILGASNALDAFMQKLGAGAPGSRYQGPPAPAPKIDISGGHALGADTTGGSSTPSGNGSGAHDQWGGSSMMDLFRGYSVADQAAAVMEH